MITNHPARHISVATRLGVAAAVCAAVWLYAIPHGALQIAVVLLVGSLVVAVGSGRYLKRRAASGTMAGLDCDSPAPTKKPAPSLLPRWASDDYRYPGAATSDRTGTGTGTRLGGSCCHGGVESMCVEVDNSTSAPGNARRALQAWFVTVNRPAASFDDAVLIVSELVTNVVVHTTSRSVVTAAFDDHRFRIEVHDHDPRGPVVGSRVAGTGRGLDVVDALCDLWGWEPTALGKRVWTETLY